MSYIQDKVECKDCGDLYDPDLLNEAGICRHCVIENSILDELIEYDREHDGW